MLLLTATSDWYLLNAFPHSSASHIRHFVILDISLKTFCRPLFVSGSNYTNIVNAWRLLQSYWLQPALSLRFLRLRSGKILFACWQRNASDLKTARLLLFCGRVNAAQGDEEDVGYTLEQRGQDPQKMEQTFTSCEQGLYYSSTRYPQRCLVQRGPFVSCVIQPLWQFTEGLKCYAARNCAGAFNQYQQLLCSQQKHKWVHSRRFQVSIFLAVHFKAGPLSVMCFYSQRPAAWRAAKIRIPIDSNAG